MQTSKSQKQSLPFKSQDKSKIINKSERRRNASQLANVNSYQHFLSVPSANSSYIQWAFGLRTGQISKSSNTICAPPQTYYKSIQSRKVPHHLILYIKHTSADISEKTNISEFQHLALHRTPHPSCGQLNFQTTLRLSHVKRGKQDTKLEDRERKWNTIPKKDRHQDPLVIKTKSLKKKILQPEEMEAAVDSLLSYPKFTQKIINNRNANHYRHMIKGRVNLPSISWQVNLRSY